MSIDGRWRIVEMELWDQDAIDLLGPAFIEIASDGHGRFRFIALEGWMDIRRVERDGHAGIEFSWDGNDECDPASGRGCATLSPNGSLEGRIFLHMGDDSLVPSGARDASSIFLTYAARAWTSLDVCRTS